MCRDRFGSDVPVSSSKHERTHSFVVMQTIYTGFLIVQMLELWSDQLWNVKCDIAVPLTASLSDLSRMIYIHVSIRFDPALDIITYTVAATTLTDGDPMD